MPEGIICNLCSFVNPFQNQKRPIKALQTMIFRPINPTLIIIQMMLLGTMMFSACGKKEQNDGAEQADSLSNTSTMASVNETDANAANLFSGQYLIGDGGAAIVPVEGGFEMRDEQHKILHFLSFVGKEQDSLFVYSSKDKSIVFKMNPDHKNGTYYEDDEQWPVAWTSAAPVALSEDEETEQYQQKKAYEDSVAFAEMGLYDGRYSIYTENEGVVAHLELSYQQDKTFSYIWDFKVQAEEATCSAERKGTIYIDQTQHGFADEDGCRLHFNFKGQWSEGMVVELEVEDQSTCTFLKGDCNFSGTYQKK